MATATERVGRYQLLEPIGSDTFVELGPHPDGPGTRAVVDLPL